MKITALAGGIGAAKLLVGLDRTPDVELTAVVNVGDDAEVYGVYVCPDIDIVTYWLAGLADTTRGWGLRDDTWEVLESLGKLGRETWFRLGDRDLATCLHRTERLSTGMPLSAVTDEIRRALGVRARILPATDDALRTFIATADGRTLSFQEYFVRERHEVEIAEVILDGAAEAAPAPGVLEAIEGADLVVLCPSNPILSIGPILVVPGVIDTLAAHPHVAAVTPIIRGAALKGPADRILKGMGIGSSASSVARLYRNFVDEFVIDASDPDEAPRVEELGVRVRALDTIMSDAAASSRLASALIAP